MTDTSNLHRVACWCACWQQLRTLCCNFDEWQTSWRWLFNSDTSQAKILSDQKNTCWKKYCLFYHCRSIHNNFFFIFKLCFFSCFSNLSATFVCLLSKHYKKQLNNHQNYNTCLEHILKALPEYIRLQNIQDTTQEKN